MVFYRNYSPQYTNWKEFTEKIKKEIDLDDHYIYIVENPYPYNCKNLEQDIRTSHWTMFYSVISDKKRVRHYIEKFMRDGYTMQAVPDEEKSILIPHIHFIKKV